MLDESVGPIGATESPGHHLLEVFTRFAEIQVKDAASSDEDGDGILAQFGTYDFRGEREFQVDLTRLFIGTGDDAQMWQLHCTLYWAPSSETDLLAGGELWSFGLELDEFFAHVRQLPGWVWALSSPPPISGFTVEFEEV